MPVKLEWKGDEYKKKVIAAAKRGVDRTMAQAVKEAKNNHSGWNNITGYAQGSITIGTFARHKGHRIVGVWGSTDGPTSKPPSRPGRKKRKGGYVIWLELKRGSFLRRAADKRYPRLDENIASALSGVAGGIGESFKF